MIRSRPECTAQMRHWVRRKRGQLWGHQVCLATSPYGQRTHTLTPFIHYSRHALKNTCFTPVMTFLHSYYQNSCLFLNWRNTNDANAANTLPGLLRVVSPDIALIIYFETFSTSLLLSSVMSALTECHFSNKLICYFEFTEVKYEWGGIKQTNKQTKMKNVENCLGIHTEVNEF